MKTVIKRDGISVDFNFKKILSAIKRAGDATKEFGNEESLDLTNEVLKQLDGKESATVEEIQDIVEKVLNENKFLKTARSFIVYREKHSELRNDKAVMIDAVKSIDEYLDRSDWRINANANQGYSLGGMILNTSGKVTANYWLSHVYPKEAGEAHRNGDLHIHDLDMLACYCSGWSLRALLQEGFNGVRGKIESNPPKHFASALGQIVNFFGCLQNENAGAQAFSSFDTYLAPYVRNDNLTYKQVYDEIQEFVFNVNVPSRWGCVPSTTKVLSVDGWKTNEELKEGDFIYTWKKGNLNKCKVNGVCRKHFKGKLVSIKNDFFSYKQDVTPNHRTLFSKNPNSLKESFIIEARKILDERKNDSRMPTRFFGSLIAEEESLSMDEISLAAMLYSDAKFYYKKGTLYKIRYSKSEKKKEFLNKEGIDPEKIFNKLGLKYKKYKYELVSHYDFKKEDLQHIVSLIGNVRVIDSKFYKMSIKQAEKFLLIWMLHSGRINKSIIQCQTKELMQQLTHIAVLAGKTSTCQIKTNKYGNEVFYVKLLQSKGVYPKDIEEIDYDGEVWCPNVEDGTAVFLNKEGGVFISGQTQTPFTNLTFDWTCPEDLKDSQPIIAGEEMDFTYSELQTEMDMINKAFIEVMTKGDAKGRLFTFPIPTYNITPDFPWESENANLLFEMTAKYGLPYFQNFLNSDLKVGDVRSMCPLTGDTEIFVRTDNVIDTIEIEKLYHKSKEDSNYTFEVWDGEKWCKAIPNYQGIQKYLIIKTDNGEFIKMGLDHIQCLADGSTRLGSELKIGDELPFIRLAHIKNKCLDVTTPRYGSSKIVSIIEAGDEQPLYCMEVQNDSHLFTLANGLLTHNCRLQLDLREIKKRGGGLFGSGEQTGSIGVITLNCARIGYLCKGNISALYERVDHFLGLAKDSLEQKRKSLTRWMEQGLYPYAKRYLGGYNTLFSTIGINGVNEMIRNFTNDEHDITDDYGQNFAISLMDHINEKIKQFQVETGNLFNLEASPGEGTTFRFAKEDKKRFSDIIQAGKPNAPYYTNSTQLPVGFSEDPFSVLDLQEDLQRRYSGGCVEAGNFVITNEGTILIEDIVKNFDKDNPLYVASFNKETNTTEWDKIINAVEIDVSKKDKINIKGEGNFNITTSDWHPFFVLKEDGSVVEKRADELKKNDKMLTSSGCLFDDKERELTEEQAYLIGYFIGDGSLTKCIDNRGGNNLERYMVRFFDEKEDVLEKVRNIIKSNGFGDVNIIQTDKRSKKLKEVHCGSKSCADFFLKYGFHAGSKTYTVNIPDEVKCQLNQKNAYALLSGLIDSDSHVDANGDVEYMTASVQLGYDIVWLCTMLGLSVSKTFKIDPRWSSTKLSRINIWHNSLLDIVEKLNTVKKICINQQKRPHSKLARKFNFVRVKETSKVNVEDNIFYDLTTENNHNYLCGKERFVFIHNTVLHLYMGERIPNAEVCKKLIKKVLENYHIPYLTITPTFSICPKHGYISGEHKFCPYCDEELIPPKKCVDCCS